MLQKNPSKSPFCEKVKMSTKGQFVVESFVTIGSFDYDYNLLSLFASFIFVKNNITNNNTNTTHNLEILEIYIFTFGFLTLVCLQIPKNNETNFCG
jgi:hypothetical protein